MEDTIAALSTPAGTGGIAIIRISGPKSLQVLESIFHGKDTEAARKSHYLYYGHIVDEKKRTLDEVLVCPMEKPKTYTREDMCEIHCHGGVACVKAVLELVFRKGVRPAQPGEFTKRAFLNGRIDLSQAESVMDLIRSSTERSQAAALNQLSGSLSGKINTFREDCLTMLAHIEASIDYPEHEQEAWNLREIRSKAGELLEKIKLLLDTWDRGKMIREGIETVILGRPNVGKSSFLNLLLAEERAIVTDIPGTTRDLLIEYVNVGEIVLRLTDTAGIRHTEDQIEKIGVEKSRRAVERAELLLVVLDASQELSDEDLEVLSLARNKKSLLLLNKSDLPSRLSLDDLSGYAPPENILTISALQSQGIDSLYARINCLFFLGELPADGQTLITNLRQKQALSAAAEALDLALQTVEDGFPEDLVAIDLRRCYEFLGEITGQSLDEDIIDKIFSEFCLGK